MMNKVIKNLEKAIKKSYSYEAYENLIEELLKEGKSTTEGAGEDFVHYSKLGLQRMKRWDKRFELSETQKTEIKNIGQKQTWVVLSEGWCGDAAHSMPIIHKIAQANDKISLQIALREQNPDLMNDFLTNGGKSIPKLIVYDPENKRVIGDWGPRPQPAQEIFLEAKKNNVDFETYEQDLQKWYNQDKGETAAKEILALLKSYV